MNHRLSQRARDQRYATALGVSVEEYQKHTALQEKMCFVCHTWFPLGAQAHQGVNTEVAFRCQDCVEDAKTKCGSMKRFLNPDGAINRVRHSRLCNSEIHLVGAVAKGFCLTCRTHGVSKDLVDGVTAYEYLHTPYKFCKHCEKARAKEAAVLLETMGVFL